MNALEKIKLSKELAGWVADIKEGVYTPMAKIKAAKRINDIVKLLGGGSVGVPVANSALEQLRAAVNIDKTMFDQWVENYGVSNQLAQDILSSEPKDGVMEQIVRKNIKPLAELYQIKDFHILYYMFADADEVKALSVEAFEAVRDQFNFGEKAAFYVYTVLRSSSLKSEIDYVHSVGGLKNAARLSSQEVGGKLYKMAQKYLGVSDEQSASKAGLPAPTKYRTGQEGSNIELEDEQLHLLGVAEITSIGSENIYMLKDGLNYYSKVGGTSRYMEGEWDFAKFPQGKDWDIAFKDAANAFGENIEGYVGAATDNNDPIIANMAEQLFGSWAFFRPYASGYFNVFYSLGGGKYGGGEGGENLQEAYDKAMTRRAEQVAEQPLSNPLYQSVIDGAPITTDLIKQLIVEGEKDPSNAQLKQAVQIIVDKVKVAQ